MQRNTPESAKRFARAIMSDIWLYNHEKIKEGIENDNFFEVLKDELKEAKQLYEANVTKEIKETTNFFNQALIDILFKKTENIESEIW